MASSSQSSRGQQRERASHPSLLEGLCPHSPHHPENQRALRQLREIGDEVNDRYIFHFLPHRLPSVWSSWVRSLASSRRRGFSDSLIGARVFFETAEEMGSSDVLPGIEDRGSHKNNSRAARCTSSSKRASDNVFLPTRNREEDPESTR